MGYSPWGVRRSQTRPTDFHFTSLQTGDGLLCLSDGELGSVGPAFGGPVALGPHALRGPCGSPSAPTAIEPSLVIHPARESSAFRCVTFALLWSENQISRRVRAAGEVSGKKPRGRVWGQGFSNGPWRAWSLRRRLQRRVQSPQIRISKRGCGACNLRRSCAEEPWETTAGTKVAPPALKPRWLNSCCFSNGMHFFHPTPPPPPALSFRIPPPCGSSPKAHFYIREADRCCPGI